MKKKMTDTEIWEQRWFKSMKVEYKCAFFFLKDRCNHAGVWEIDIINLKEYLNIDAFNLEEFLTEVNKDFNGFTGEEIKRERVILHQNKYLWLVDYLPFHWGGVDKIVKTNQAGAKSALNILNDLGILKEGLNRGLIALDKPIESIIKSPDKGIRCYNNNNNININNSNKDKTKKSDKKEGDSLKEITTVLVSEWNAAANTSLRYTNNKKIQVRARLKTYSKEELVKAIRHRAADDWIKNNNQLPNWDALFRNDDQIDQWLNRPPENKTKVPGSVANGVSAEGLTRRQAKQYSEEKRIDFTPSMFTIKKNAGGEERYVPNF